MAAVELPGPLLQEMYGFVCELAPRNIYLAARHIPGYLNFVPDLLSRVSSHNDLSVLTRAGLCCR